MNARALWSLFDMLKLNGEFFYGILSALMQARGAISVGTRNNIHGPLGQEIEQQIRRLVTTLEGYLRDMGAEISAMAAAALLKKCMEGQIKFNELEAAIGEIDSRITDEMSIIQLFVLERGKEKFYEPKEPIFGVDVQDKFPSATFEIDEAAKCLALSRPTASVFHLMRTIEFGLGAIHKSLGLPAPEKSAERNWGTMLRTIKSKLDNQRENASNKFFYESYTSLDAVRNVWRNATMHVENKYTDEEAEHIFYAVRGFMMKVAARIDENGEPKA